MSHDDLHLWQLPVLGWVGAAASIAAYYLVSSKRFAPDSLRYHSLNVSSCILLAMACASTGAWPSFLTNAIFIGVGCTMIWRVRDRLARRIMQVVRFFDVRRYLPRRRAWRALAESSLNWGREGAARGLAPSLYPPTDKLRRSTLMSQGFIKVRQGKVCKADFTEKLERIDGKTGNVRRTMTVRRGDRSIARYSKRSTHVSFRRITPSSPRPSRQGAPTAQPPAVLDGPPLLREPRRPLMERPRAHYTSAGHPRVPGTFVSAVLLSRAGTPRCGA